MTVQLSEYFLFGKSGIESLPEVFLHDNCEQIFFVFLQEKEMRSGTHFTQQNVFLPVPLHDYRLALYHTQSNLYFHLSASKINKVW
jgi:hypothetical protein